MPIARFATTNTSTIARITVKVQKITLWRFHDEGLRGIGLSYLSGLTTGKDNGKFHAEWMRSFESVAIEGS